MFEYVTKGSSLNAIAAQGLRRWDLLNAIELMCWSYRLKLCCQHNTLSVDFVTEVEAYILIIIWLVVCGTSWSKCELEQILANTCFPAEQSQVTQRLNGMSALVLVKILVTPWQGESCPCRVFLSRIMKKPVSKVSFTRLLLTSILWIGIFYQISSSGNSVMPILVRRSWRFSQGEAGYFVLTFFSFHLDFEVIARFEPCSLLYNLCICESSLSILGQYHSGQIMKLWPYSMDIHSNQGDSLRDR